MSRSLGGNLMLVALLITVGGCRSHCQTCGAREEDDDVRMTIDQVPPAVRATIEQHLNGGTITELERSNDEGRTTYDVTVKGSGGTSEFEVGEDGAFLGMDDEDEDNKDKDEDDKD